MKALFRLILGLSVLTTAISCDAFRSLSTNDGTTSLGKPYELVVVCNQQEWDGVVGDSLRALFLAPVAYINQEEPLFHLLRVNERGFTQLVPRHRNILKVQIGASAVDSLTNASARYNVAASPQIEVTLRGANSAAVARYLGQHGKELIRVFEDAERERATAYATRFNEKHIGQIIRETFGFDMTVPKGYVLAKQGSDFIWCRYEYPTASQGFCIYSYPYQGKGSLSEVSLLSARNRFMSQIPGPSEGSHMTTSTAFAPDIKTFRLDGRAWIEMRGFWDVESDFMGGPFVSYTTLDTQSHRVVTIDCYVYSPDLPKRNFLRGVEHLLYMVQFPTPIAN